MAGYRLANYQAPNGARAGIIIGDSIFDAAALTDRASYATMLGILEDWPRAADLIQTAMRINPANGLPLADTHLRAPLLRPGAIYCAGANYRDHAAEMAKRLGRPLDPDPKANGGQPWHFLKVSRSVADPGATIAATGYSKKLDWEVELAAVIGRPVRNISVERALDCVAGYTCANDLSARDMSKRLEASEKSPFHFDWTGQKSFDGACPLGPWIVPADDIPNPQDLFLKLWVNDVIKQDSNTAEMIFTLADQIAHLSRGMTLYPGDVILTGTPAGVGTGRGEFLNAGDVVRIEIERIGTLTNRIV
jgi:2-keto-4-pentenoate hydratase/2-oxohepta-3-ene-1,7-dioic acid hydratase in catechol pathway